MQIKNILSLRAITMSFAFALIVLQVACGKSMKDGEVWKEEVRMMNGELIIVDRRNRYGEFGDMPPWADQLTWAEIQFDYNGKHYWWGERSVAPKALQIDPQGRFYIVTTRPYCGSQPSLAPTKGYYVVFRFEGAKWARVPIADVDVNTVFNLAGSSQLQHDPRMRDYVKETDAKYKDLNVNEHNRRIVPDKKPSC